MTAFRLAHISDPHLPPPQGAGAWRNLALKRLMSRFAWRRKRRRHSPKVLAAIIADIQAEAPDHIAITGDLTNFSTPEEYAAAQAWLASLGPAERVTVSPGNHDALVGAQGAARFAPWAPWLGEGEDFPKVRRTGPVALVNLCSAVPTAPHLAQGELGPDQLGRLRTLLSALKAEGLFRVVLLHHPPTRGVVSARKALRDRSGLLEALAAEGAELVLHGHAHIASAATAPGPDGAIPVLGVPSASTSGGHDEPARWHCLEIKREPSGWMLRVKARGLGADGAVGDLGGYRYLG